MSHQRVLVTFNGKSFDWPMVKDRSTLHRPDFVRHSSDQSLQDGREPPNGDHCDLLHHARRRWKCKFPNCRLQTLERLVCGRHRVDDIPGGNIPALYHEFVRTRDVWTLQPILHHNALDLVTLIPLSAKLVAAWGYTASFRL